MKRIFVLAGIMLVLLAACGGGDSGGEAFTQPTRPNLVLQAGERSVGGALVNICWPKGEGNTSCEPTFGSIEPQDALAVTKDDAITIGVGPAAAPDELVVKSGNLSLIFRAGENAQFPVNALNDGRNRVEVTAYYFDLAGAQAVVSSVFAVDVATGTAVVAVATPTTEAGTVATATQATPTEATTEEPTDTPVIVASPTAAPVQPTNTPAPPSPTSTIAAPTASATQAPPQPSPTPTSPMQTTTITPTDEGSGNQEPTATQTVFVSAPAASPTVTPTLPPPTGAVVPTAVPLNATDLPVFVGVAPEVKLRIGGREYASAGVDFCRRAGNNQQVCIAQPTDTTTARVRIGRGNAFIVRIGDTRPGSVAYEIKNPDTLQSLAQETRTGDNNVLLSINLPAGDYLLAVNVVWTDKSGTYYFRVQIVD
jgi:hypothetical protein